MSVPYAPDPSSVNFAADGPRAFQQTTATAERDQRRARPVDAERRQALADLAQNKMPSFWHSTGPTRPAAPGSSLASAHPFETVTATGRRGVAAREVAVPVPIGAARVTITKGAAGHFGVPEQSVLRQGFAQVTVALLQGEEANVAFCSDTGAQLGFLPVCYSDGA
jgi:hypothetical protein